MLMKCVCDHTRFLLITFTPTLVSTFMLHIVFVFMLCPLEKKVSTKKNSHVHIILKHLVVSFIVLHHGISPEWLNEGKAGMEFNSIT